MVAIIFKEENIGMKKTFHDKDQQVELCKKYLSGKQTRKEFCVAHEISAKSLSRWLNKNKRQSSKVKFLEVGRIEPSANLTAEIILSNGIKIRMPSKHEELIQLIIGLQRCN